MENLTNSSVYGQQEPKVQEEVLHEAQEPKVQEEVLHEVQEPKMQETLLHEPQIHVEVHEKDNAIPHKSGFDEKDIADNKVFAMASYLLGIVGIIVALLGAKTSEYAAFHVRQSLKLSVCGVILAVVAIPFGILSLIPFLGVIFKLVLLIIAAAEAGVLVLKLIAFAQVCEGKAKEPYIIGSIGIF